MAGECAYLDPGHLRRLADDERRHAALLGVIAETLPDGPYTGQLIETRVAQENGALALDHMAVELEALLAQLLTASGV